MIYQPPEITWSEIVLEIVDNGWTVYRIAKTLNVAETTVWNWVKGREGRGCEPRFGYGCMLIDLHRDVCRRQEKVAAAAKSSITEGADIA